jgi:diguanylate cyclase (GGDEF)-like protein
MTAAVETWKCYAQLLARLSPRISHILFASGDGTISWSSDPANSSRVQYALSLLLRSSVIRHREIDGLIETEDSSESRYGFRIRGALGEVLGLIVIALPTPEARLDLESVHSLIKPVLDCLQRELSSPVACNGSAEGLKALGEIPILAIERLEGLVAAILVPERKLTICRRHAQQTSAIESDALAQMHRHLMTRAQLHGRTLVANRVAPDGTDTAVPFKALSTPIRNEAHRVVGVLAVFRADTARDFQSCDAEALELMARQAAQIIVSSFDTLTGLLTSAAFRAETAARLAQRDRRQCVHGMLYVDIDQLNVVNENHGMHVGDEVIQGVANLLSRRARQGTVVARMDGDRFCMFVPGCGIEPAARIAEELRSAAISMSRTHGDKPLLVSLSIGVARLCDSDQNFEPALAAAELACQTAKERGRNRVEVSYGGEQGRGAERAALATQAGAALAAETLELLAQPILPLSSAPADPRFEILLRMRAPDGMRIGLEKLTGGAAGSLLNRAVDRWVVEQTIERLADQRERLRQHPAKFSVNLSAASLADAEFWRMLADLVRKSRIEPGTLGFEFPEEAANAHLATIAPFMCRMREQGISFALDNFGRGIGALARLNALPVSCIKIDGRFSRDLVDNTGSQSIVLAIATLANSFGLETVATQVETDAIRACAAQLGVDYGQGFFIGKPLALDDALRDLPLYSCFASSTGLFDPSLGKIAALR